MTNRPLSELNENNLAEWYATLTREQREHTAIIYVGTPSGELIARRIVHSIPAGPMAGLFTVLYDHSLLDEWRCEAGDAPENQVLYDFRLTVTPTKSGRLLQPHGVKGTGIALDELAGMIHEVGHASQVYFEDHPEGAEAAG